MTPEALVKSVRATEREQLLGRLRARYPQAVSELPDKLVAIEAAVGVFERLQVSYALIGGLAVGIHSGVPRATLDVDFAIPTGVDRALLTEALSEAGFVRTGQFAHSLNFQHTSGEPVQLAFDPAFDPMLHRATSMTVGALRLRIVTREDLLAMKRRAAQDPARRRSKALRDEADIALLEGDIPEPNEGW